MASKEQDLMYKFVDSNIEVYQRKWGSAEDADSVSKWNWPAFLITPYWLAYRKMYIPSIIIHSILTLLIIVEMMTGIELYILMFPVYLYIGIQANKIYYKFVQKKVREIGDEPARLMREGGTAAGSAFVIAFSFFILDLLIGFIVIYLMN